MNRLIKILAVCGLVLLVLWLIGLATAPLFGQMPPDPILPPSTPPPPKTNLYYLNFTYGDCTPLLNYQLDYGTQSGVYQFSTLLSGTNGQVSNLLYGTTYWFSSGVDCTTNLTELQFPPPMPPLTNFVLVSCAGTLLLSKGWTGARFPVTNRLFKVGQEADYFWWSTGTISAAVVSNNQPTYAQYQHKQ